MEGPRRVGGGSPKGRWRVAEGYVEGPGQNDLPYPMFSNQKEYIIISSEKLNNDKWYSIKNSSLIKAFENKVEIEKI